MFRNTYIRLLTLAAAAAAAALAAACTADPTGADEPAGAGAQADYDAEPASLTVDISIADIGIDVSTRAGETDPGAGAGAEAGAGAGAGAGVDMPSGLCGAFNKADLLDPEYTGGEPTGDAAKLARYNEAQLVNGSKMVCLTVLLVHRRTNRIVAVRRIPDPDCPDRVPEFDPNHPQHDEVVRKNYILNADGSLADTLRDDEGKPMLDNDGRIRGILGTRACVTFDYERPIHVVSERDVAGRPEDAKYVGKSAERLRRGEYTIVAVANYDHNVTTSATAANERTLNIDVTLENIANLFHQPQHMAEGIYPFAPVPGTNLPNYQYLYNLRFLMNRTLNTVGTDSEGNPIYDVTDLPVNGADGTPLKPYIRPAVHQTLTASKDFYLEAGNNRISLKLLRIASRTRVEVKNYGTLPLKVHSLEFSPNYTQSTCYLFRRDKNDRDYSELAAPGRHTDHDGRGAPLVGYTGIYNSVNGQPSYGAIVPFIYDHDFDKNGDLDGIRVEAGTKRCIFDALLYETHVGYKDTDEPANLDSLTYTIDVSYPAINNYKSPDKNKVDTSGKQGEDWDTEFDHDRAALEYAKTDKDGNKDYIRNPTSDQALYNSIDDIIKGLDVENGESCCFMIQSVAKYYEKFIYEQEDGTLYADRTHAELSDTDIDVKSYLWFMDGLRREADGTYTCYLRNLRSGKHMPTMFAAVAPTEENHMKSTDDTSSQRYILGVNDKDNNGKPLGEYSVTFKNIINGTDYFLSVWGQGPYLGGWTSADQGCQYRLYPVKMTSTKLYVGSPRMKKTVKLTAFSDETAFVEDVREIRRNDFVRILVEVSYNSEKGDFQFRVVPWDKRTGAVDFH